MVKLTAELIEQAAQYTNAVRDRELDLRGARARRGSRVGRGGLGGEAACAGNGPEASGFVRGCSGTGKPVGGGACRGWGARGAGGGAWGRLQGLQSQRDSGEGMRGRGFGGATWEEPAAWGGGTRTGCTGRVGLG